MSLLISLVFVWVLSGATLAKAENEFITIGDMRSACEIAMQGDPQSNEESVSTGLCFGWVLAEDNHRGGLCSAIEHGNKLDDFSSSIARDTLEETMDNLIEGFLNWLDQNPEWWSQDPYWLIANPDFWSEFPCKIDN